jgi:phosphatidylglycerol:prolipoprotein diacylglycerol transferase
MRSILFSIPLDGRVDLPGLGKVPVFGIGILLTVWCLFGLAFAALQYRREGWRGLTGFTAIVWFAIALAIFKAPEIQLKNHAIPVYGYGTMLFLGFLASASLAAKRLRREGADGEIAWDAAMWIFVSGLLGARLFYVVQYAPNFFGPDPVNGQPRTVMQILFALINLPDGGLVLYGGLILAPVAYYLFCVRRGISPLAFGDIAVSSVFVGLLFGRLGCFLHGCCYGDLCELPWGVRFPAGSVPFEAMVHRGLQGRDALRSLALHPTQLYDSLSAVAIVAVTWVYYPYRRRNGEVLAIGWMAYPINRFLIEFLRSDESGKFGTTLTISQWVSLGLFASGLAYFLWLQRQPLGRSPLVLHRPADFSPAPNRSLPAARVVA